MSVLRSAGVRSTAASFVEVALFFCLVTPLFAILCYGAFHAIHGPTVRMRNASELTELMTVASQATERISQIEEAAATIDPESRLGEEIVKFTAAIGQAPSGSPTPAQSAQRIVELAKRKTRQDAEEVKAAFAYADEAAKTAASMMLADALKNATTLSTTARQVNSHFQVLWRVGEDVVRDHRPDLAEARKEKADALAEIEKAQKRITDALKSIEKADDPDHLADLEAEKMAAETAKANALKKKADATTKAESLDPLPPALGDLIRAIDAIEHDANALSDRAAMLNERMQTLSVAKTQSASQAVKDARDARDEMIQSRTDAAEDIAKTSTDLEQLATAAGELAQQVVSLCAPASDEARRIADDPDDKADKAAWNVKRTEVAAAKLVRRAARAVAACRQARRTPVDPGQGFRASLSQGLGDIRLNSVLTGRFPFLSVDELIGTAPWWVWIIEGLLYLLLITIYWAPGQSDQDKCELRAFGLFLLTVVVAAIVVYWSQIAAQVTLFFDMVNGRA